MKITYNRTDRYNEAYALRNRLDDGPAWRQAYLNSDRVDYDGVIGNNPLRQWWLRRGRGKRILGRLTNQIPPSSAEFGTFTGGADTTYNVDNCISLLKDMIARYTELTGLLLVLVPRHQSSRQMWWFELLPAPFQELVRAITSFKANPDTPGNKKALEQLAPYIYLVNESAYNDFTANGSGLRKSVRGYFWLLILILTPEGQFLIFSYSSYTRS